MAKKRSWLYMLKKFLVSDKKLKQDKDKGKKWLLFGRTKIRGKSFPIALPLPPEERTPDVSEAEAVLLTSIPQSSNKLLGDGEDNLERKVQGDANQSNCLCSRERHEHACIKIQTAYRGYLARKALRALKGIVKLQAIIRGRNMRRQAMHTLKCLQSIVDIHSQVCAKRIQVPGRAWNLDETNQLHTLRDKIIKMDMNSDRRWDGSALTKEEVDALFVSKKDAAVKRERVKEYAFNRRNSAETDRNKVNGRLRYWLDQWVDTQAPKSKELEDLDSVLTSTPKPRVEYRGKQLKLKGNHRQYHHQGLVDSPMSEPRRSLHRKQCSLGEDHSFSGLPAVPTYMAATESAKAKARSLSSPRLRPGSFDAYSDSYSPCKNRFNVVQSTAAEVRGSGRHVKLGIYPQMSPSLKSVAGTIKSSRTLKDISFDSECSFKTWHQEAGFRYFNN